MNVSASKLTAVYDTNLFRIRTINGEIFGTYTDVNG